MHRVCDIKGQVDTITASSIADAHQFIIALTYITHISLNFFCLNTSFWSFISKTNVFSKLRHILAFC